jgi:lipoprotein-releasing system ATP-binding protein
MSSVLSCSHLSRTFSEGEEALHILRDINLDISAGERVAIMGASGSGKSTLLHLLGGLDNPTAGEVFISGVPVAGLGSARLGRLRNSKLGFVYQFHHLLPEFTALENVAMPLLIGGSDPVEAGKQAEQILEHVGLSSRLTHKPGELSGGERQRAAVARALVTHPQCILADEPTGNLDRKNAEQVFDLMLNLNQEHGASLLIVTHDASLAERMDRILYLQDGSLVEE